ncbi:endonuclease MutS2 [Lactobacillus paragasseri]|uniref:endonuclease MutS2 n=1 Tax=Lactobacillus paragasseri TaxID=2107999 RepID=UPI00217D40C2|nr:DNA mismatch repair protein MutS [Lactobacillus paragasseri]UWI42727.1 DNA mismatch repair protein MutS [Lactobacillus paragasseri]UWI45641.1 DNA mismatch repair protein MutS [Lactobacillus paragasseri]
MNNTDEIEFSRVRKLVSHYAVSPEAKDKILVQPLVTKLVKATALLDETAEMVWILNHGLHIPFISSDALTPILNKVKKGFILNPAELEQVADFIRVTRLLVRFFNKQRNNTPITASYCDTLTILDTLESEIYNAIERGQVADKADKDLAKLRQRRAKLSTTIQDTLQKYLQNKKYQTMLQDYQIIQKDNHYTLPIKASFKHTFGGNIIDQSNNGNTVFIEPTKIARLAQEKAVIENQIYLIETQILGSLSAKVYEELSQFEANLNTIIELDCILARAKYSQSINGKRPTLNEQNQLKLQEMRHPLLSAPVPLSLNLDSNKRGLIITGPNAGGKTITLKTVGLAIAMTEFGLFLPSASHCSIPIMAKIYTSIGDHQDLDNSLSTFSAEMKEMSYIVKHATPNSLILLDELGSGTDPNEGAALAIALLQTLQLKGCLILATTHYSAIKDYSTKHPAFITAAMDFNLDTLKPTYKLLLNQIGASRALWIAEKIGMPQDVLTAASDFLNTGNFPLKQRTIKFKKKQKKDKTTFSFQKGDRIKVPKYPQEVLFYQNSDLANQIIIFVNKTFKTVPAKGAKLVRKAEDLYPAGYNLDLLFVQNWQEYKLNKDLNRGSKKALKKLKK